MKAKGRIVIDDEAVDRRLREKAESRRSDALRLERGEVTPEELQRENSMFPEGWIQQVGISNLYENVGRAH